MSKLEGKEIQLDDVGAKHKSFYEERRIRRGKTRKDKENGAHANRMKNRAARNEWCNDRNAKANQHPSGNK